ncbi:D-glycero-alpha-D-manno-heptose-1,7-bisphosphate 7-phosphatase [Silvibacterium dinghuense]|uniref:D,D-heptose 1,7-bisphosphate phosphatase n=1 Tax=Silvibacterium dinghuense TaxID=1560006 RepID=A0A4Q1S818_9BACT|nr:HAD family hydrolase [Silvibacterium dinghuense]RXS93045.1 HAD family hydrolase [Silvibacterium dinghuense]GGG89896.1 hypothetical protein GCM10011586_00370 [Silvibacterium dinghuense]
MVIHHATGFDHIRYILLDRDGVINHKPEEGTYIGHCDQFHLLPGVAPAIAALNSSGRTVIVITNQRGIALGLYSAADVEFIHQQLQMQLAASNAHIDGFYLCPHDRNACDCRKPKTGLFTQARRDFPELSTANSLVIGDSLSDIEAARNFGAPSFFLLGDPATRKPGVQKAAELAVCVIHSLAEGVARILGEESP